MIPSSGVNGPSGGLRRAVTGRLLHYLLKRYPVPEDAVRNMRSFARLSGPAAGGFPTELLGLGASMWSGFILTPFAEQQMAGWILPYWLRMQREPSSPSFVPHGHIWVHCNLTHRNWTGVGICGFPNEAAVDPRGLMTPWPFGPSVDVWVRASGELMCPSRLEGAKQKLVDGLPVVETSFEETCAGLRLLHFVAPIDDMPFVFTVATVINTAPESRHLDLVISSRPYNNETVCAVNDLSYDPVRKSITADGNLLCYFPASPDAVLLSDYASGDVANRLEDASEAFTKIHVREPCGLATGAVVYHLELEAGEEVETCAVSPLQPGVHPDLAGVFAPEYPADEADNKLQEQLVAWSEVVARGMRIEVCDERYQRAFDVNKAFLMLMFDGMSITPGISTYHMMWFRDAAYLVPAMDRMGHHDKAKAILSTYPDRQTPEGFFRSHNGEWDSNGQAMWTLVNHYRMTGDLDFIKGVYPAMMKGARWIDSMRRTDLSPADSRFGLLPEGISAEHFGISNCYYWDDMWSVAGLRAVAGVARDLGLGGDADYLESVAGRLWADVCGSLEHVATRLGYRAMPCAPDRDVDAGSIGSVAAVYPLELIEPEDEIMVNTVSKLVERSFFRDTHYHSIMHCGINPYMSMHVAQYYLRLRDPYALTIFESLWSMATPTFTYPEAINPLTGGGSYGDGHDGWSACDILNFIRNVFICEEGDTLVFLPLCRRRWFDGNGIKVTDSATRFGGVSYSVALKGDSLEFSLPGVYDREPSRLRLNAPFAIESCEADGEKFEVEKGASSVAVPPSARRVVLRAACDRGQGH